jgi:tetrapyrrole methylase family protein/MazG family protein
VIAGTSFVDATCAALALDPLARGMVIADATDLARQHFPHLDPDQPALIGQLSNRDIARDLLRVLRVLYPRDHIVTRVDAAGTRDQKIETLALAELDRTDDFGSLTTLYIPPLARPSGINALAEIIAHLRAPNGCPWDREQTHQSLRKDFLEECYEVLETLDENDIPHLREELGDLMLHIIFQTQIASESSEFLLSDVIAEVSEKLVRRHPHVFGAVQVNGKADVIANWDKIKQAENGGKKKSKMPRGLPALLRAQKVAKKMTTNSGNTTNLKNVAARVEKLSRAKNRGRALGEILFALAAHAQAKHIDAESALRKYAQDLTGF